MPMISDTTRLVIHAVFGATLGFFTACIFLALYYGTQFSIPVPDAMRFQAAFWGTGLFVMFTLALCFKTQILEFIKYISMSPEGDDE